MMSVNVSIMIPHANKHTGNTREQIAKELSPRFAFTRGSSRGLLAKQHKRQTCTHRDTRTKIYTEQALNKSRGNDESDTRIVKRTQHHRETSSQGQKSPRDMYSPRFAFTTRASRGSSKYCKKRVITHQQSASRPFRMATFR